MNRREFLAAGACLAGTLALDRTPGVFGAGGETAARLSMSEVPRLDSHAHIGSPRMVETLERAMGRVPFPSMGADRLIERLDGDGIERAWILSEGYIAASDMWNLRKAGDGFDEKALVRHENDFVGREAARFPHRLVPFLSVNPKRPYAVDEIDRCVEECGARGLKLHCWNSLMDVRDQGQLALLRTVLSRAASRDLPVVVHAFNGSVKGYGRRDVEIWARELVLPIEKLHLCFAHLGGAGGFAPPAQEVLSELIRHLGPSSAAAGRVTLDMSAVLVGKNSLGIPPTPEAHRARMAELLTAWGCDRVRWGSDSIPGYLRLSRSVWPLGDQEWKVICRRRGMVGLDR